MLKPSFWKIAAILAVGVAGALAIESQAPKQAGTPGRTPVVVELFTSQGCSSCPPADALLRRIARDPAMRGRVIPLAFHVDYWNRLGWSDPFSSREWSQRQGDYVRALKLSSAYTPQVVVNGTRQMVGSSTNEVLRAIDEESRRTPEGTIALALTDTGVTVRAQSAVPNVDVLVAIAEESVTTDVKRGENGGRTLVNDAIVRKLVQVGTLNGKSAIEKELPIALEPRMSVAAFLQERGTRRILAATFAATRASSRP
jgi:hypothetical protein